MGFLSALRNIAGTILGEFQVGIDGPKLQQVGSTDRLLLPNNLRFTPGGAPTVGFVQTDGNGDMFVAPGGGGGITATEHKTLRQLIHFINEGPGDGFSTTPYRETTPNPFPTSVIWYEDNTKAKKIFEIEITRDTAQLPTAIAHKIYASDGTTVLLTATDSITRSGIFETSRSRAFT